MTPAQLDTLRRVATTAQGRDMDIGMGANVVLALLDEVAALRARLAAAERVVWATRSFPNALTLDALDAYDALVAAQYLAPLL